MSTKISTDLKYRLYEDSVQNHEADIDFINEQFEKLRNRKPLTLREDFGGTAIMACAWARQSPKHQAWAIDLDEEPQAYGLENHHSRLKKGEKVRMEYVRGNVLDGYSFKTDVIASFNFSYFVFKGRPKLVGYFKQVFSGLNDDGIFFVDIFGGTECFQELEETTEYDRHDYVWDCHKYNPLTHEVTYYIHFKDKEKNKNYKNVFVYDWRHWSVMEVVEAMKEAGFPDIRVYWEEDDNEGEGNGVFYESTEEDNCESWVCYIAALK